MEQLQGTENETATLAGGCFWCLEAVFELVQGIEHSVSGYAGGLKSHPSYEEVCTGATGHAEVVQLIYDPSVVTFSHLLGLFFATHDPTILNRQGPDVGTQYRSAIFWHTKEQQQIAEDVIAELSRDKVWRNPIVTELVPFTAFYPAEEYHQGFYRKNPDQGYCQVIITPKLAKLRKENLGALKV